MKINQSCLMPKGRVIRKAKEELTRMQMREKRDLFCLIHCSVFSSSTRAWHMVDAQYVVLKDCINRRDF